MVIYIIKHASLDFNKFKNLTEMSKQLIKTFYIIDLSGIFILFSYGL